MSAANYIMAPVGVENGNCESKLIQGNSNPHTGGGMHAEMQIDTDVDTEVCSPTGTSPYELDDGPLSKKQKKTKGRVKIKMEFIDNKLRRYTTFSKRKTGIMKKAYELSTLTGTQVMLLVASETGHVYTFATRKLQPMITSESGKALIQTCLNSPDLPGEAHTRRSPDQRMCATGFEETELSYSISEEDEKDPPRNPMFTVRNVPGAGADVPSGSNTSSTGLSLAGTGHTYPMTTYLPTTTVASTASNLKQSASLPSSQNSIAPPTATTNFTTLLPQGTSLASGTPLPTGLVQVPQLQAIQHTQVTPTALVRLPQQASGPQVSNASRQQLLTTLLPTVTAAQQQALSTQPANAVAMLAATTQSQQALATSNATTLPAPIMYQTPQGVVYATSAGTVNAISEALLFNYQTAHQNNTVQTGNVIGHAASALSIAALPLPIQGVALSQQHISHGGSVILSDPSKKLNPNLSRTHTA